MLIETLARFGLGGLLVVMFAIAGACLEPKTFSGIFGAAPSVALASLAMSYAEHGAGYERIEGRSMIGGAAALSLYCLSAAKLVQRRHTSIWLAALLLWIQWLGVALLAWVLLRS